MSDLAFKNQFQREVTAPGIRTAMGLDRGKGTAFVLKSDITYKHWNFGNTTSDKGHRPKRIFKGEILSSIMSRILRVSIKLVQDW